MVNFGPLTAEIDWRVWDTPSYFNVYRVWQQRYCTASSSGHQPNFAALNRGRHLCSAGRSSGLALAHILVLSVLIIAASYAIVLQCIMELKLPYTYLLPALFCCVVKIEQVVKVI